MGFDLLICGCGYLGQRVAQLAIHAGQTVATLTRTAAKADHLRTLGITSIVADLMVPASLQAFPHAAALLYCVGHDRSSVWSKRDLYLQGRQNVLAASQGRIDRWVDVSSTSVYGQDDGSWVDETSPTIPTTEGGMICRAAEQLFENPPLAPPHWTILRLSGLYGPDRMIARVDQLRAGEPVGGSPDSWLNLIHRDDAARACQAALRSGPHEARYLVSDDRPIQRSEYYGHLATLVGAPPPRFTEVATTRHSATGQGKRCRNQRVREELGLQWTFPTIQEGLAHSLGLHTPS